MNTLPITRRNVSGFTIVELLIVIVVIAVLAAIVVVAYNGVSNRAKTSSATSAAANAVKKAEAYAVETGGYPAQASTLTGAASSTTYQLTGVSINGTALAAAPTNPSELNFYRCGTAAAAAATSLATVTVITGVEFRFWNYQGGAIASDTAGQVSGNSPAGYNITCYITT